MTFNEIEKLFDRAFQHTFERKKWLLVSIILALCGVLVVFFRALAFNVGEWVLMSLTFLPIFVCGGVLLATGVILIRIYHDEIKKRPVSYRQVLNKSLEIVIGASYFFVPIILCYLLLWILLGVFFLLRQTPSAGEFIAVLFSFCPFLLNLGSLLLGVLSICLLFFVTPAVALKSHDPLTVSQFVVTRLKGELFTNTLLLFMATLPLVGLLTLLLAAVGMTGSVYVEVESALAIILQWFFIMIPFTIILSPMVIFFFNFAAEAHVYMRKKIAEE